MTLYYQDEHVTLYHGDCREMAPGISADAVVTDPPYGDTTLKWDQWPEGWVESVNHIPQLWSFGSMRMFLSHHREFGEAGYRYAQEIIWEKQNGSGLANDRFKRVHEIAMQWYSGTWGDLPRTVPRVPSTTGNKSNNGRGRSLEHYGTAPKRAYVDDGYRLMKSVFKVNSMTGKALHPTEKPAGVLSPLIRYSVPDGGVVLDCFAGSGSTLVTARELGLRSVGIEMQEKYCEIIAKRLDQQVINFDALI